MSAEKKYNNGAWTQGRMDSFIKGLIRQGLKKWGPKHECLKRARVERGKYKCAGCGKLVPATTTVEYKTKPGEFRKVKNIYADHIEPIVDPHVGRQSWDEVIQRAFVDTDGYQALCYACHEDKTQSEKRIARERLKNNDKG